MWTLKLITTLSVLFFSYDSINASQSVNKIRLPDGFKIEVFADDLGGTRFIALSPDNVVFATLIDNGKALALSDNDNDGKADRVITFIKGLTRPHGIAFHNGYLYIGETDQITRFKYDDFDKESGKREVPIHDLPTAYSTPPGFTFYTREPFPEEYRGDLFVALHGSWNRSVPTGYKVIRITIEGGKPAGTEDFATGWLECDNVCGRPVDVLVGSDGGLVVSDDGEGIIYRITTSP